MKRIALLLLVLLAPCARADIKPDNTNTPILLICAVTPVPNPPGTPAGKSQQWAADTKHPAITVTSVRDLRLGGDMLSTSVQLNDADAKTFEQFKQQPRTFAVIGPAMKPGDQDIAVLITTTQPITDGGLGFAYSHRTGIMATYLRRRFHIGVNSNAAERQPVSVPPATNAAP